MASTIFREINRLIRIKKINNSDGFTARDIHNNAKLLLNLNTIRSFLSKHTSNNIKYFERISKGKYRVKTEYLFTEKECFVAFIDILGFSSLIKNHTPSNKNLNVVRSAVNSSTELIEERKKLFDEYEYWYKEFHIKSFSDCFCFSVPLEFDKGEKDYTQNFISFYLWISVFYNTMLSNKFICRGGFSQDWHYDDDKIIFSKGLINAYKIESTRATHPIIMLDDRILENLQKSNLDKGYIDLMFAHDNAGRIFINPFYYLVVDEIYFGLKNKSFNDVKDLLIETSTTNIIDIFLDILNSKIREHKNQVYSDKYQWLKEFLTFLRDNNIHAEKFSLGFPPKV